MKLDILAIGVHPDDVELSCSGTLIKHIQDGKSVGVVDLTQGELGTRGSGPLRLEEAKLAADIMGVQIRENLGMRDGFFEYSEENLRRIMNVVCKYRPEIVLANALSDRHPDHGRAAKLISDACFYSGLSKIKMDFESWRPKVVYHYIQDHNLTPDFAVDISDHMDQKIASIMAYKSQFYDPNSTEKQTPISSADFIEFIKSRGRVHGRPLGVTYAEGYNVARTPGVNSLFSLI